MSYLRIPTLRLPHRGQAGVWLELTEFKDLKSLTGTKKYYCETLSMFKFNKVLYNFTYVEKNTNTYSIVCSIILVI